MQPARQQNLQQDQFWSSPRNMTIRPIPPCSCTAEDRSQTHAAVSVVLSNLELSQETSSKHRAGKRLDLKLCTFLEQCSGSWRGCSGCCPNSCRGDWPQGPRCLAKPEQVARQRPCKAESCPGLHPLPTQCLVIIMALSAEGLLPQPEAPGTSALTVPKFVLLFPPLPWSTAEPHSPESLSNVDLAQGEKPLQSWGLPAPWDLCMAAKPLEAGRCRWHWTGGTETVVVGHDCAGAWSS